MNDLPKPIIARLAGRCANGAERDAGRKYHILERYSEFGTALCGAKPGRTSGGWAEPLEGAAANCPRCLKRAAAQSPYWRQTAEKAIRLLFELQDGGFLSDDLGAAHDDIHTRIDALTSVLNLRGRRWDAKPR